MIVVKIQLESAEDEARLRDLLPSLHGTLLEKEELPNSLNGLEVRKQRQKKALEASLKTGGSNLIWRCF